MQKSSQRNPYTLQFGKEPTELISRITSESEILESFLQDPPSQQIFMITGVRGSGKTVLMTNITKTIREYDDWIVAELNPELDLLKGLAARLSSSRELTAIFREAQMNLSLPGIGIEFSAASPMIDLHTELEEMLLAIKKRGKKLLVTIDEASDTKFMREFAGAFQIFVRGDLPIFLLMTGLHENIYELQNEKNLTFLYRAPKIELKGLNLGAIAANYQANFAITQEEARKMAELTRGYSFAFQVLGYLTWRNGGSFREILPTYRQYLEDYVYEKLWSELSACDKKVAAAIAACPDGKVIHVREKLEMSTNQFNPYRKRLIKKGLVSGDQYGYVRFELPLFEDFVLDMMN